MSLVANELIRSLEEINILKIEIDSLRKVLIDFRDYGTRHDITPTTMFKKCKDGELVDQGPPRTNGWNGYIREMDEYVRNKAKEALNQTGFQPVGDK